MDDKLKIRRFKDGSSNFWVGNIHLYLNEVNKICFGAGGILTNEYVETLQKYLKRTKSTYIPRAKSQIDEAVLKQYSVIGFGKYSSLTTQDLIGIDKKYARWLYENCSDNKIKTELKELLKIK